jgi:hypothetical protein
VEARVGELVPFSHDHAFRLRPAPVAFSGSIGAVIAGLLVLTDFLSFIRENSYHVLLTDARQIIRDNVGGCRPTPHPVYGCCPRNPRRSA